MNLKKKDLKLKQRSTTCFTLLAMLFASIIAWVVMVMRRAPLGLVDFEWFYRFNFLLIIVTSIIIFALLIFTGGVFIKPVLAQNFLLRIKRFCETGLGGYLVYGALAGAYLLLSSGTFALVLGIIHPNRFSTVYFLFICALPFLILWFVSGFGIFFLLTFTYGWYLHLPDFSLKASHLVESKAFGIFWIISTLTMSMVHWLSLIFQWPIDSLLPLWYWRTTIKSGLNTWLILPLSLLFFGGYWLICNKKVPAFAKTLTVLLVGYLFMIGFAAIEGSPYQVLYEKRYISGHRNYIAVAARNEGGTEYLYDYEAALGHDRFFATKPPGVYLTYRGLLTLGSLVFPHGTYEEKYDAINHTLMLLFPLLALSSTLILEKLTRQFTRIIPPQLPGYLLIIVPNFLLLQGTIDQAIMPLLFLAGFFLGMKALKDSSWVLSMLFGSFIYLSLYFSFSLLPLVILIGLWMIFEAWRNWRSIDLKSHLKLGLGSIIGFGLLFILLYTIFDYSPWVRYQNAMVIHEIQRIQPISIRNYLAMYLLNNLEFATWVGFPLMITSGLAIIQALVNFLWGRWQKVDSLMLAFLLTYAFLNHFSRTLSEVARLWLFLVPLMCLFAVYFIKERMKKKAHLAVFLFSQWITAFLITQYILITWE